MDTYVFDHLPDMLNSRDVEVREWTADILGMLARHDFGLEVILNLNISAQLVSLLQ
jgi:hypothetical protein